MSRIRLAMTLAAGVAGFASGAESLEQAYAAHGRCLVTQFVSAPFPHASRAEGHRYRDTFYPAQPHYADNTVALFVPKNFRETGRVDVVVHFHGWRNTVAGTLQQFQLVEQLVESRKNAVLIVPAGPHNAPDSAGGKLEEPGGFRRFMAEAMATLRQHRIFRGDFSFGDIILSGHSGGYQVISSILDRGGMTAQVREVWLFDGLYGQTDKFLAWADRPTGRLLNIYTDDGGTKLRTEEMMATLRQRGVNLLAKPDTDVTLPELKTNRFVFLHTDLGHNDVLAKRKTFADFLKTSFLADVTED